jgi:hypothetical protein
LETLEVGGHGGHTACEIFALDVGFLEGWRGEKGVYLGIRRVEEAFLARALEVGRLGGSAWGLHLIGRRRCRKRLWSRLLIVLFRVRFLHDPVSRGSFCRGEG